MPLGASDVDALDLFDEVANAPEHGLTVHLERGDMLVINNYTLLHARARSTTHPQPGREHRLVRLWLDSPGFRDVPKEFSVFRTNGLPRKAAGAKAG